MKKIFLWLIIWTICAVSIAAQKTQPAPAKVDLDDDGVPVIVKHLPDWEKVQKGAQTFTTLENLPKNLAGRFDWNVVQFDGATEAVTADYAGAKLVIVEFATPQTAIDADAKIQEKIGSFQNVAYRKTGNYSVFVFDAANETQANTLLDAVKYEKTVQWLGGNPYLAAAAAQKEQAYIQTTGEILVTVLTTAGLAVVAAFGVGGLVGAILFYRRRRELTAMDGYTDAGGMMRLNLDELSVQQNPNRLLEK